MIYTGSLGEISNKADWTSPIYNLVQESDGTAIDLSAPALAVAVDVVIRQQDSGTVLIEATLVNGKAIINGTGFQWHFLPADLAVLCPGTYDVGVSVTISGVKNDIILASVSVLQGV